MEHNEVKTTVPLQITDWNTGYRAEYACRHCPHSVQLRDCELAQSVMALALRATSRTKSTTRKLALQSACLHWTGIVALTLTSSSVPSKKESRYNPRANLRFQRFYHGILH